MGFSTVATTIRSRQARSCGSGAHQRQGLKITATKALSVMNVASVTAAAASASLALVAAAVVDSRRKAEKPKLHYQATEFNKAVLELIPSLQREYLPLPFMTNPHLETILCSYTRKPAGVRYRREVVPTPDGGVLTLDWGSEEGVAAGAPVLILLPGLTGGSGCTYIQNTLQAAHRKGIRTVVFNSRGTAGGPVTTPQLYSSSYTGDMKVVVEHVCRRYPDCAIFSAGWSLGSNILVNYVGEMGQQCPLAGAAAFCNPLDLEVSSRNWASGFNRIYNRNLAQAIGRLFLPIAPLFHSHPRAKLRPQYDDVADFDRCVTAPTFGWRDEQEYYKLSSSALRIPHVHVPLLLVNSLNDPICPSIAIPYQAIQDNPNCILVTTRTGGHLGWAETHSGGGLSGPSWDTQPAVEWVLAVHSCSSSRPSRPRLSTPSLGNGTPAMPQASSSSSSCDGALAASRNDAPPHRPPHPTTLLRGVPVPALWNDAASDAAHWRAFAAAAEGAPDAADRDCAQPAASGSLAQ